VSDVTLIGLRSAMTVTPLAITTSSPKIGSRPRLQTQGLDRGPVAVATFTAAEAWPPEINSPKKTTAAQPMAGDGLRAAIQESR
jgi:hypothetical protein